MEKLHRLQKKAVYIDGECENIYEQKFPIVEQLQ